MAYRNTGNKGDLEAVSIVLVSVDGRDSVSRLLLAFIRNSTLVFLARGPHCLTIAVGFSTLIWYRKSLSSTYPLFALVDRVFLMEWN